MTLYVDLDNTLFDFSNHFVKYANKQYGVLIEEELTNEIFDIYDFYTHPLWVKFANKMLRTFDYFSKEYRNDNNNYKKLAYDAILNNVNFFENMPFFPNSKETIIKLMNENINVEFITTLVVSNAYKGKYTSLNKHFGVDHDKIHNTTKKHLFVNNTNNILVDDNPYIINQTCQENIIVKRNKFNNNCKGKFKFENWEDFYNLFYITTEELKNGQY